MKFVFLIDTEAVGAAVRWTDGAEKSPPEVVAAARAAGFSDWEIQQSPLGVLEQDFGCGPCVFKKGAMVLIGMNGSTLIEISSL